MMQARVEEKENLNPKHSKLASRLTECLSPCAIGDVMSEATMNGSCKCGNIHYVTGDPLQVVNCHCSLCRNINGSAFSSYVVTPLADFKIEQGEQMLRGYAATDHAIKHFCATCGTPLYNINPVRYPGLAMIYFGTLEKHDQLSPGLNVYCSSKMNWVNALHSIRSFDEAPQRG